ncbi:MAG: menD, partial [Friedmanniella sp.]|nr:menD [Friedmanniella sp.]
AEAAAGAGVPLLAEPSSNARRGAAALATGGLLLHTDLGRRVERVVLVGHPTLTRPVTALLSRPDVELVVVSPYADWPDPGRTASRVVDDVTLPPSADWAWLAAWREADGRLGAALAALLDRPGALTGPVVARTVWAALGADDTLVLGASNPVRDVDLAPLTEDPPTVYANRGLAGIDGTVSTAVGVALAVGAPTHLLLGDVTLLHDSTGLVLGPSEPRPDLRIVVANDDGGSIFAGLEHGRPELAGEFERLFGTPHGVRLGELAAAAGVGYTRVGTAGELAAALAGPPVGLELVEAVVDRTGRRALQAAITGLAATL